MNCKVCGATPETADFYNGIGTYCKEHWRGRVKANRLARLEQYREYDRQRASRPDRVAARAAYQKTENGKAALLKARAAYASRHPLRRAAHVALGNAVRDGKVIPQPCFMCGEEAQAHHPDYSRPLDVVWLCPPHHRQAHAISRKLINQLNDKRNPS